MAITPDYRNITSLMSHYAPIVLYHIDIYGLTSDSLDLQYQFPNTFSEEMKSLYLTTLPTVLQ